MFLINRNYVQIYFTPAYFYIIQIEANVSNLKKLLCRCDISILFALYMQLFVQAMGIVSFPYYLVVIQSD